MGQHDDHWLKQIHLNGITKQTKESRNYIGVPICKFVNSVKWDNNVRFNFNYHFQFIFFNNTAWFTIFFYHSKKVLHRKVPILFTPRMQTIHGKVEKFYTRETLCQEWSTLTPFWDTWPMYLQQMVRFLNWKYVKLE